jgi:putative SOS response-associated peptidase YedK
MVGDHAQDHEAVEPAPALQCRVINRPTAHRFPPPDPLRLLVSKRRGKVRQLLTVGKFRNNARRDNLEGFWKDLFGVSHGVVVATAFYENVSRHRTEGRELAPGEEPENLVLEFKPRPTQEMLVACLWSRWTSPGESELLSFAAITDEPPPEVAAAGHDRCIIPIRPEHVDAWLSPDPKDLRAMYEILDDRDRPYYEHKLAA